MFVAHHGAGSSGLSFALFASAIRKTLPSAGVLSLDARGHGGTVVKSSEVSSDDEGLDLSLETLSQDLFAVIRLTQEKLGWAELPGLLLIGHSLGGAVVTDLAMNGRLGDAILGYAVLDVVEGTSTQQPPLSLQQHEEMMTKCFLRLRNRCPPKHAILPLHPPQILPLHFLRH